MPTLDTASALSANTFDTGIGIGTPPWSVEEMLAAYPDFKQIYAGKPVLDNAGGMKAPHAFMTWFILRKLSPALIIESGVWKGQGTWLIEKACPDANLICLDIDFSRLQYHSKKATYIEKDFSIFDFGNHELSDAVCFFDDHQNALTRMQQMIWKGFNRAIFEDNYPPSRGDCYSPKKILSGRGFIPEAQVARKWLYLVKRGIKAILRNDSGPEIVPANTAHANELRKNLAVYYEVPPLFKAPKTRWGDDWTDGRYPTKPPLFDETVEDDLRAEAQAYNWMCYIEMVARR